MNTNEIPMHANSEAAEQQAIAEPTSEQTPAAVAEGVVETSAVTEEATPVPAS